MIKLEAVNLDENLLVYFQLAHTLLSFIRSVRIPVRPAAESSHLGQLSCFLLLTWHEKETVQLSPEAKDISLQQEVMSFSQVTIYLHLSKQDFSFEDDEEGGREEKTGKHNPLVVLQNGTREGGYPELQGDTEFYQGF